MVAAGRIRIGFVPEHFSTPLHFAVQHFGLAAELVPFPSGTGHMITSLRAAEIDVGIGLTEGWIAGLGKKPAGGEAGAAAAAAAATTSTTTTSTTPSSSPGGGYKLVGTYVTSPLRWAISTGRGRSDIQDDKALRGGKCGISRLGSGSYVMAYVLAEQRGWLPSAGKRTEEDTTNTAAAAAAGPEQSLLQSASKQQGQQQQGQPFDFLPLGTFERLRAAVNDSSADFFMWEYFTSKKYYDTPASSPSDSSAIKHIGDILTPWPSWHIVARDPADDRLPALFEKLDRGVEYFGGHRAEAVEYISTALDYSAADADAWYDTVEFARGTKGVEHGVVETTIATLAKAGVLEKQRDGGAGMLAFSRADR